MDSKKGPYLVKELKSIPPGRQVWGKYLVLEKVDRRTRDGRAVSNLRLGDATGEIDAVVWDSCNINGVIETGRVVGILGDTSVYANRLQLTARRIKELDDDPALFQKSVEGLERLQQTFNEYINSLEDPCLKLLLQKIFSDETRKRFFRAPAARKIHHQYAGGLLEHTVAVASLCLEAAAHYPGINRDLVLAGALLHDLGKIEELDIKVSSEYTVAGRMLGHIFIGSEIVSQNIALIRLEGEVFPSDLEIMIKHMVLSHHGQLEFGSPVKPLFPEALLLHLMDNLDAKMHVFWNRIKDDEENPDVFTPYDQMFNQHYYKHRYQYLPEEELREEGMEDLLEERYD